MNIEGLINVILFVAIPELVALGSLAGSALVTWRARTPVHVCLTLAIFITVFWSLMILYQIYFLDMNQITISPLYLNGISFAIFVAQFFLFAARTHDQKT